MQIEPFVINIAEEQIADLRQRLQQTRFANLPATDSWGLGTSSDFLHRLVQHWIHEFDWSAQQRRLNQFPQFMADLGDCKIHFIHQKGVGPNPLPLILTHGWPGSFVEMEKIIPLLTDPGSHGGDPADAFDVVVPSLPGFGFSSPPAGPAMNSGDIADRWLDLMKLLGYPRFATQGGDIGAGVSSWLAIRHPESLCGLHLNFIPSSYSPPLGEGYPPITTEEEAYLAKAKQWAELEGGYAHEQSTKPTTLAVALNDSPVGLAAWMVEKFRSWSDCDGELESVFSLDELLTNISLYWFTGNIHASLGIYKANRERPLRIPDGQKIVPPLGVAHFPKELPTPPRSWLERCFDVRRWSEMAAGGHFAAMEQPELLAAEIRAFFSELR